MVGTEAARVPPDEVRVSAELALPGKKLLLAPSFRFFFFSRGGCTVWGAPPSKPPSTASFDASAKPLQPFALPLHGRQREPLGKEINSPVPTHTHTHTHTRSKSGSGDLGPIPTRRLKH